MKIAIHHRKGSFSDRWIDFCEKSGIVYKIVNCYDSDIIAQVKDCNALMWHHHHGNYKDVLFAKGLLFSLVQSGIKVFPDFNTTWHFDDKVGQKYLLEAIGAPLVPSYVFYDKKSALQWLDATTFPKVFKLRGGAGASNVSLVNTKREAVQKIKIAFGRGFSQFDRFGHLKERYQKMRDGKGSLIGVIKALGKLIVATEFARMSSREKGYVYFQDFIPNNSFDIRVIVTGDKAFALKRMTRKNDFRASGSGAIRYGKNEIDERCVKIAFDVNDKIHTQSIAYDFVFDENNCPLIVEISYGYAVSAYDACPGYWSSDLVWHKEVFNPQEWILQDLIRGIGPQDDKQKI